MRYPGLAGLLVVCFGLLAGGCGGPRGLAVLTDRRTITIVTAPAGAAVQQRTWLGGWADLGVTPIMDLPVVVVTEIREMKQVPPERATELMRQAGGNVAVTITKEGYLPYRGYLATKGGETAVHEITLQAAEELPGQEN